ncbi:cyclase family protein [Actinokineospora enzanensis]|uniref:cyclase family protein n=1 Tax=Actinokineospora enzanensis TaxID=155975 RepID=UPI00036B3EA6|nr:cyclase family protein [Actinokineospora enzanensis]
MPLIDLSSPIDAEFWEPDPIKHEVLSHADGARHVISEMRAHFDLDLPVDVFPDGEFLSNDFLYLSAHTGTHIDAPLHYGSKASYGRPRSIDELPLEWFHGQGVRLDLRAWPIGAVGADALREQLALVRHKLSPGDIVLLHTGAERLLGSPRYFTDFVGLDRSGVDLLLDAGVRVIGTDAFSLDAPFPDMINRYHETGRPEVLWPAHFAGREREYCQIERLGNLGALPSPTGFTVTCFPVKVARSGAGWCRAVAFI